MEIVSLHMTSFDAKVIGTLFYLIGIPFRVEDLV